MSGFLILGSGRKKMKLLDKYNKKEKIIIALDGNTIEKSLSIAKSLKEYVWGYKINDLLYEDTSVIDQLKEIGRVFVDVKLYDIPNTVANTVRRLSKKGADIITVHASGGIDMMKAAKKNAGDSKIIAVTVLTSTKSPDTKMKVLQLTKDAIKAGVDGIVCSSHELQAVNKIPGMESKLKIVPGIRPEWYTKKDDQVRTMTPAAAISLGVDYLVIGRPITESKNPLKALKKL